MVLRPGGYPRKEGARPVRLSGTGQSRDSNGLRPGQVFFQSQDIFVQSRDVYGLGVGHSWWPRGRPQLVAYPPPQHIEK
jgi:hypothetical protein